MSRNHQLRQLAILPIRLYQKTLSFDHGWLKDFYPYGYCPFYPSCSEYACQTIVKDGLTKGFFKMSWRLCRCHPWTKGGVDMP